MLSPCAQSATDLADLLSLSSPPLAISFTQSAAVGTPRFSGAVPAPAADGRTGKVPAGCVFWMHADKATFSTNADDHANCSVGSVTHGFRKIEEVASKSDVAALLESGWVTMDAVPKIPVVKERPTFVTYGPLKDAAEIPDVVFLRLNAKQAMVMSDAIPDIHFEGKPQCHIIPMAKEDKQVAISVGCMLSRVRTGMPNTEMTCAIPGGRLDEVLTRLRATVKADKAVAAYAATDAKRFQ